MNLVDSISKECTEMNQYPEFSAELLSDVTGGSYHNYIPEYMPIFLIIFEISKNGI